jgi:hypothetical protein
MARKITLEYVWSSPNYHRYETDIDGGKRWHIYIPRRMFDGQPPERFDSFVGAKAKDDPQQTEYTKWRQAQDAAIKAAKEATDKLAGPLCECGHERGAHFMSNSLCYGTACISGLPPRESLCNKFRQVAAKAPAKRRTVKVYKQTLCRCGHQYRSHIENGGACSHSACVEGIGRCRKFTKARKRARGH